MQVFSGNTTALSPDGIAEIQTKLASNESEYFFWRFIGRCLLLIHKSIVTSKNQFDKLQARSIM